MKRDMDLVREILRSMEQSEYDLPTDSLMIEDRSDEELGYHIRLMNDAGLVKASFQEFLDGTTYILERMTWDGHEFLDAARSDTHWQQAKKMVLGAGKVVSIETLKWAFSQLAKA